MGSEKALWNLTRKKLAPYGRLVRIESPSTEPGIPDVCYCIQGSTGFIELKEITRWPVRATTAFRISHLSLEQVVFAEAWTASGGASSMLLQVGRDYLLLGVGSIRKIYDRALTKDGMVAECAVFSQGKFPTAEIVTALTMGWITKPDLINP